MKGHSNLSFSSVDDMDNHKESHQNKKLSRGGGLMYDADWMTEEFFDRIYITQTFEN